ncbi:MAG: lipoyl(octanoyl) transferase LipB [Candidatus Xenobia bacterium]
MRQVVAEWRGRVPYRQAWEEQRHAVEQLRLGQGPERLWLLEHPPVITLGRGAKPEHVLTPAVEVVETDRGGDVTWHGPGQLVGYPLLDLRPDRCDVGRYLRDLEEVLIRTLARFGVAAARKPGLTGVWVPGAPAGGEIVGCPPPGGEHRRTAGGPDHRAPAVGEHVEHAPPGGQHAEAVDGSQQSAAPHGWAKIAAIGVRMSRWCTMHGFALNVCPELSHFDLIVPCGIRDYGVTSLAQLLDSVPCLEEVAAVVCEEFGVVFGRTIIPLACATSTSGSSYDLSSNCCSSRKQGAQV